MGLTDIKRLASSFERAKLVALFTDACSLIYHCFIFIIFTLLKVYPMAFYNVFSISVFAILFILCTRAKNFLFLFFIASAEVIAHQILADYFLGSATCFHYFILLMGILPFLIFEKRFKFSIPLTIITTILFIVMENLNLPPQYEISSTMVGVLKFINVSISIVVILLTILLFTVVVYNSEENLEAQKDKLESEIKMASVIQQSFFKHDIYQIDDWDIAYYSKAMAGVSGDIFDFYKSNNKLDGVGIFDVSGHGISSGLVTMLVKNIIHQEFYNHPDLELWEILNHINDRVIEEKGEIENYLTGILVRTIDDKLEVAVAGHPMPIIYRKAENKCEFLVQKDESVGAIGIPDFPVFYTSNFFDFNDGDELVLYSDGVSDILNEYNHSFTAERLLAFVESFYNETAAQQVNDISQKINIFRGTAPQNDDITFIVLKKTNA